MTMRSRMSDGPRAWEAFEALEGRRLLDGEFPFEAVFPEGYAADNINEYVPITNTNDFAVSYELVARYEFGDRDQVIDARTIAANTRGGVTISEVTRPSETLVRKNVPYALVLRSSAPLAATLSHYDFGTAIGEAFTYERSTEWSFGDGSKDSDLSRDYILVYNPSNATVSVTITLYRDDGSSVDDTRTVGAQRRGGWSINDVSQLGAGVFAAKVTASGLIVASQSHYELRTGRGYGALGTPGGGAVAGIVSAIKYDDDFYGRNGDDSSHQRFSADSYVSILNTNDAPATMTLHFFPDVSGSGDPAPVPRVVIAAAHSRTTVSVRDLALPAAEGYGVVYRSNVAVTVTGSVYQGQDGTGVTAGTLAATEWRFGEGFMSRTRAGQAIIEDIYLFNPGAGEVDVTVQFMFTDGSVVSMVKRLEARELENVHVDRLAAVLDRAEDQWYGILVTCASPITASMEHWDGGIGGGFQTFGTPGGTVVNFSDVLTL